MATLPPLYHTSRLTAWMKEIIFDPHLCILTAWGKIERVCFISVEKMSL
jgi:hypothetical protein